LCSVDVCSFFLFGTYHVKKALIVAAGLLVVGVSAVQAQTGTPPAKPAAPAANPADPLSTTAGQASYAIGMNIGNSIKNDGLEVNLQALVAGIADAMAGNKSKLTDAQAQAAVQEFVTAMQARQADRMKSAGDKNKRDGEAFLASNKQKQGVITLPSGLQYMVIKAGNGKQPKLTDTVTTHYHGTLIDGTVFDSSVERGEPATFSVGGVIRGWTEALQLMKVGDKWRLFVPSELAYGPRSPSPEIGPNSVLVFDVELLNVE
jgi:FKBP-type peptidyl-prolyl cis-trans isomerase FklB